MKDDGQQVGLDVLVDGWMSDLLLDFDVDDDAGDDDC